MTYYVVAPWGRGDKYSNATIMSEHSTPEDAYEERDLLGDVVESSPDGLNPYVVDGNHLPQDYLPPNQLPVGEWV